jgi:phosphatidylserine decarboxylase
MGHGRLATRLEQFRQARRIHGGVVNAWTAALGVRLSRVPIPGRRLRLRVFRTLYGRKYAALDESECDRPLGEYRSINALFTRGVRPECRPIATAPGHLICPCDGRVQDEGAITPDRVLAVKGVRYTLASLLPGVDTRRFAGGRFAVVFLSPADCHRVFCPADATLHEVIHVPGARLLVHPPFQRPEFPVFTLNERVVFQFSDHALVMVAGWGVGRVTLAGGRAYRRRRRCATSTPFQSGNRVQRGEWLATFELGSTVILLSEARGGLTTLVARDDVVRYGQPLMRFDAP